MTQPNNPVLAKFRAAIERDSASGRISEYMTAWYWKELNPQYGDSKNYDGPIELVKWVLAQSTVRRYPTPSDFPDLPDRLAKQVDAEQKVFSHPTFAPHRTLIDRIDFQNHGAYSVQDFHFQTRAMAASEVANAVVLDFGPGVGRMAAQWAGGNATYIGVEAIAQTYCMQYEFYSKVSDDFEEYVDNPDLKIERRPGAIFHIPSWRMDLVPDQSVDLITTVQVLGELRVEMLDFVVKNFARVLKDNAFLYVRDHGRRHNPNKANIKEIIANAGFELIYEPDYEDLKDIHGIPKLWRRTRSTA